MEEHFAAIAGHIALGIEAVAVLIIAFASIEATINIVRVVLRRGSSTEGREVWMRYARWLIAGLTFQLAGDIVHTAIAPTWDEIGKLAAVAVIRTFLTYFLDRDMEAERRLDREESSAMKKREGLRDSV